MVSTYLPTLWFNFNFIELCIIISNFLDITSFKIDIINTFYYIVNLVNYFNFLTLSYLLIYYFKL